jgi:hypothetical protein
MLADARVYFTKKAIVRAVVFGLPTCPVGVSYPGWLHGFRDSLAKNPGTGSSPFPVNRVYMHLRLVAYGSYKL